MLRTQPNTTVADAQVASQSAAAPVAYRHADWRLVLSAGPTACTRLVEQLQHDPDQLLASGNPLKLGRRCTVMRVATQQGTAIVKRFNHRGKIHAARHAILPSRAARNWWAGHALRAAGVPVPQPLAYCERRIGPLRGLSYVVLEDLPGVPLGRLLHTARPEPGRLKVVFAQLQQLWQRMLAAGLSHGDFRGNNFLVNEDRLSLVDLDAVRQHLPGPGHWLAIYRDRRNFLQDWRPEPHLHSAFQAALAWPAALNPSAYLAPLVHLPNWTATLQPFYPRLW